MVSEFDPVPFSIGHIVAQKHHGAITKDSFALCCYKWNEQLMMPPWFSGIDPCQTWFIGPCRRGSQVGFGRCFVVLSWLV